MVLVVNRFLHTHKLFHTEVLLAIDSKMTCIILTFTFGDLEGEFWYRLKNIHHLTARDQVELRIDMVKKTDGAPPFLFIIIMHS